MKTKLEILKGRVQQLAADEGGDISVKGIAGIVAVIVIIGAVVTAVTGFMPGWIGELWESFKGMITDFTGARF